MRQILTPQERKEIRSDIHRSSRKRTTLSPDQKTLFFSKYCANKRVLDLGCVDHDPANEQSDFWLHKALKNCSREIVGLDYYEEGCNSLERLGYNVVVGDAQSFDLKTKFEVITAGDLIEHLPNLDGFIQSIKKHLIPSGTLIISTPNPWCWKYHLAFLFQTRLHQINKEHICWFCEQTLTQLFARYGMKIIERKYTSARFYENHIPLPAHMKHTTLNLAIMADT
jgi:2-polyprenyl-3-methyl-5-hydroxy-6-metoxy-1,4-benzoquinol methylase